MSRYWNDCVNAEARAGGSDNVVNSEPEPEPQPVPEPEEEKFEEEWPEPPRETPVPVADPVHAHEPTPIADPVPVEDLVPVEPVYPADLAPVVEPVSVAASDPVAEPVHSAEPVPAAEPIHAYEAAVEKTLVGHWRAAQTRPYPSGGTWFIYSTDSSAECSNGDVGRWEIVDATARQYLITWQSGSVDSITLAEGGMTGQVANRMGELYILLRQVAEK